MRRCCSLLISCSVIMLLSLLGGLFFGGVCVCVFVYFCVSIFHFVTLILSYYKMIRGAYSVRLSLLLNMFMKSK